MLERLFTDSYIGNKPWLEALLKAIPVSKRPAALQRLLGRKDGVLPANKVTSFDLLGVWYVRAQRKAKHERTLEEVYREGAVRFADKVLKHGLTGCSVLWGFNGASLELFKHAKQQGIHCILDQTSNPKLLEQRLTEVEHERWHEWLIESGRFETKSILRDREHEEWALADTIVAGSEFVRNGLIQCGTSQNKIHVIPSGIDLTKFVIREKPPFDGKRPLRVLFVGRVSVMKGIPYLLEALASLGPDRVEARLIGGISICRSALEQYLDVVTAVGAVPRSLMAEQYQWADVFCFPSITEGSAAVTYEAIASGLPVITTPNAGAIVRDGIDGFIVPIRDADGLARAMSEYIEHPDLVACHKQAVAERRNEAGLERYRSDLVHLVQGLHPAG
jgi:glycosyltransferase involved in cell wall biosynthesis